jgi:hypothetical protein
LNPFFSATYLNLNLILYGTKDKPKKRDIPTFNSDKNSEKKNFDKLINSYQSSSLDSTFINNKNYFPEKTTTTSTTTTTTTTTTTATPPSSTSTNKYFNFFNNRPQTAPFLPTKNDYFYNLNRNFNNKKKPLLSQRLTTPKTLSSSTKLKPYFVIAFNSNDDYDDYDDTNEDNNLEDYTQDNNNNNDDQSNHIQNTINSPLINTNDDTISQSNSILSKNLILPSKERSHAQLGPLFGARSSASSASSSAAAAVPSLSSLSIITATCLYSHLAFTVLFSPSTSVYH